MDFGILLISSFFFASLVRGEGGCRDLRFLDCQQDKVLTGHVIKVIRMLVPSRRQCQHECFRDERCVSFNLGPVFGVIRSCELNDSDHVQSDDVKTVLGAEYCPIENPCSSNPCRKGKICEPDFAFNTYRCIEHRTTTDYYTTPTTPEHGTSGIREDTKK